MRVTQQEMSRGHQRIVEGAARLLRERGLRSTSVADAMNEAGMTHGGFYRHFGSKDDLLAEALRAAFDGFAAPLEQRQRHESPASVVADYKAVYLSDEHVGHPGLGCPMPAVGSDVSRDSDVLKAEFGRGVQRVVAAVAEAKPGPTEAREAAALRELALMVGAVLIARASDPKTAQAMLQACRD